MLLAAITIQIKMATEAKYIVTLREEVKVGERHTKELSAECLWFDNNKVPSNFIEFKLTDDIRVMINKNNIKCIEVR
jgi:hypothetical protein